MTTLSTAAAACNAGSISLEEFTDRVLVGSLSDLYPGLSDALDVGIQHGLTRKELLKLVRRHAGNSLTATAAEAFIDSRMVPR